MEEMEWLGWLCAFGLILHCLRVVQNPLRGGCKTQPHHLLVTNHFASLQGLRDELRPWGETGAIPEAGFGGGGMLGGEGSCPSTQPQNHSPRYGDLWRESHPSPALGKLCASKSLQVLLALSLRTCLSRWDAAGDPPQGAGCGSWRRGGDPILPPPPFTATCLPRALQTGTAGDDGQVDVTSGFVPLASPRGQTGPPATGDCCQRSSLFFLPKPLSLSSPAPALCCHLPMPSSPSSSSRRPGAARTKCGPLAYSFPLGRSSPIPVPACLSLSL